MLILSKVIIIIIIITDKKLVRTKSAAVANEFIYTRVQVDDFIIDNNKNNSLL